MLLGLLMMAAEGVAAAFGLLAAGGAAIFLAGLALLLGWGAPMGALPPAAIALAAVGAALLLAVIVAAAVRAHRRRPVAGGDALAGQRAVVLSWSGRQGVVRVDGERWQARADVELRPGQPARVRGRDALVLTVEPDPGAPS